MKRGHILRSHARLKLFMDRREISIYWEKRQIENVGPCVVCNQPSNYGMFLCKVCMADDVQQLSAISFQRYVTNKIIERIPRCGCGGMTLEDDYLCRNCAK
jgi:hypothetical protein